MFENLNNLIVVLCRTISTRQLYFGEHPKVASLTAEFLSQLKLFCEEHKMEKLFIGIIEGNLVFEGRNLVGPSIVGKQFIRFADKLHCGGFSFAHQTSEEEFKALLNLTSELNKPVENLKEGRELLVSRDIFNIEIAHHYLGSSGPVSRDQQSAWQGQDTGDFLHSPTLIYQALFDSVAQAHGDVMRGNDIDIDNTKSVSEYMLHFTQTHFSDMMQHVHYPDYDSYTVGHSVRVAALAVYLAHSFNWSKEVLLNIGTAGLLHDVGKSRIPEEILYKPGKLNKEEFSVMMAHSQMGAEILMGQKNTTHLDVAAAWGHHIRHDGSGYPSQPKWAIRHPITSLLQICDAFEALTAARPYKPVLTPHMAFAIMLKDKGGFNPALLASFIATVGIYPPGNLVKLSDGTKGLVIRVGTKIDRPTVKIMTTPTGEDIPPDDQYQVDLNTPEHQSLAVSKMLHLEG
ncbi:MAG: HD domain-containing protein [Desulfobulbaceae bacterium]|nr:MAG: HD domain-containing protein [Desulfobulbaceae bacterium]